MPNFGECRHQRIESPTCCAKSVSSYKDSTLKRPSLFAPCPGNKSLATRISKVNNSKGWAEDVLQCWCLLFQFLQSSHLTPALPVSFTIMFGLRDIEIQVWCSEPTTHLPPPHALTGCNDTHTRHQTDFSASFNFGNLASRKHAMWNLLEQFSLAKFSRIFLKFVYRKVCYSRLGMHFPYCRFPTFLNQ